MRKLIVSLVVVGALAGAAFASAARLNLGSPGLQTGSALATGCQGDQQVTVSYQTHFDDTAGKFVVDGATLDGVADACPAGTTFDLLLLPADPLPPLALRCEQKPPPSGCEKDPGPQQLPAVQLNGVAALMKDPGPTQ